jgi:hypothetical protein
MRLLSLDVRDKTNTTSVVLVAGGIQTVVLKILNLGWRRHGALLKFRRDREHSPEQQQCQAE